MRRTVFFIAVCSIVGFSAVAHSQQRTREPARLKPGFFGRMLGLESIPNPRLLMNKTERVRAEQNAVNFNLRSAQPAQTRSSLITKRPLALRPVPRIGTAAPVLKRMFPDAQTAAAAVVITPKEVDSAETVSTPATPKPATTPRRSTARLSLADILQNRQSQPLNDVNRVAPEMDDPFLSPTPEAHQPIASGPVPQPPAETIVLTNPEPTPLSIPVQSDSSQPLAAPVVAAPELPAEPTPTIPVATPVIVTNPDVDSARRPAATPAPGVSEPNPARVAEVVASKEPTKDLVEPPVEAAPVVQQVPSTSTQWRSRVRSQATVPVQNVSMPSAPAGRAVARSMDFQSTRPARTAPAARVRIRSSRSVDTRSLLPVIRPAGQAKQVRPTEESVSTPVYEPVSQRDPVSAVAHGDPKSTFEEAKETTTPPQVHHSLPAEEFAPPRRPSEPVAQLHDDFKAPIVLSGPDSNVPLHPVKRVEQSVVMKPVRHRPESRQLPTSPVREETVPGARSRTAATHTDTNSVRPATLISEQPAAPQPGLFKPAIHRRTRSATPVDRQAQRMQAIADRPHLLGFKGFCPVQLIDNRQLRDASLEFYSTYGRRTYYFGSAAARARFVANPRRYVPAAEGRDVVLVTHTGEELQGKIDFSAWYRGRLFLFTSAKALEAFNANPAMYGDRF